MKRTVIVMVCGASLAGCSQLTNHFIVDAAATQGETTIAAQKGEEAMPPINLDTFCFPEDLGTADAKGVRPCARTAYDRALKPRVGQTKEETRLARNQLMLTIIRRSEVVCNYHKGAIMANSAAADFSTGLLSSVASTLSSAFSPVTTKTALSTVSAISSATGTGLRANVYQNVLAPAVVTEINNQRAGMRSQILARKTEDIGSYPITEALYEVERYHELCSFYVGLAALAKDRTPKARSKEDIQQEIEQLRRAQKDLSARTPTGTFGNLEKASIKEQYELNSRRILTLLRLQEIAPGQNQISIPAKKHSAITSADDALRAAVQASTSVNTIRLVIQQMKQDKTRVDGAVKSAVTAEKAIGAAALKSTGDVDLQDKAKLAIAMLKDLKKLKADGDPVLQQLLQAAEKAKIEADTQSTIAGKGAESAVELAKQVALAPGTASAELNAAKALVAANIASEAALSAAKLADQAKASADTVKKKADQAEASAADIQKLAPPENQAGAGRSGAPSPMSSASQPVTSGGKL